MSNQNIIDLTKGTNMNTTPETPKVTQEIWEEMIAILNTAKEADPVGERHRASMQYTHLMTPPGFRKDK
jgi:hypothetical protein